MIWSILIDAIVFFLNQVFVYFPKVTELPFGSDEALVTTFTYFYQFLDVFWPLEILWTCVLAYWTFRIGLWIIRMVPIIGRAGF